ncbi:MAG TPA: DUF4031 domain-containing protein [Blastocatellia bacterium]|nr:DUF4031 domain-containing protein [Blastocatellia bacterium]
MAILIDSFQNGARGPFRYWHRRCGHLVSDSSLEELHEFAAELGLRREWFQMKSIPHYDLTGDVYELAIERGAILVSSREIVRRAVRLEVQVTVFESIEVS